MKLIHDLYEVIKYTSSNEGFIANIRLNPAHIIYAAHFPGHPVTPGVIQLQIVHELAEEHLDRPLKLVTIEQCKFLKILNPAEFPELSVHVAFAWTNDLLNLTARGENNPHVFFKLQGMYRG